MLSLFKGRKAIGGEAKSDITMIREVIVRVCLVFNNNMLFKKRTIMKPIKNICCHSRPVGLWVLIGTVLEMSSVGAVRH